MISNVWSSLEGLDELVGCGVPVVVEVGTGLTVEEAGVGVLWLVLARVVFAAALEEDAEIVEDSSAESEARREETSTPVEVRETVSSEESDASREDTSTGTGEPVIDGLEAS